MDYQITCVCGHRFLVPDSKIGAPVTCPDCGQRLSPVVDTPKGPALPPPALASLPPAPPTPADSVPIDDPAEAPAGTPAGAGPVSANAEQTKRCPFCGEVILAIARKCKHCGEFLDRAHPALSPTPSPAGSATAPAPVPPDPALADVPPVYTVSVSQWDNFWKFVTLLIIAGVVITALWVIPPLAPYREIATPGVLVLAAFVGWFFFLAAKNTRAFIRPTRIDTETGILSKDINSLELFRISDIELKQGFLERILGIGTIKLMTADNSNPELVLYQIPKVRAIHKYIQTQIPIAARQRGAIYMEK
jgi:membrane protein YdbS with pleckstrin-like domain